MKIFALLLFISTVSAAPEMESGFQPKFIAEKKDALPKFEALEAFELAQRVDLESLEDQKVTTLTKQRFHGNWEKDRNLKVKYLDFLIESKMTVPGFGPFQNKQDLGKQVKNQELHFIWKDGEAKEVKGVKELREKILNANSNPVEKATLGRILQEDLIRKNAAMFLQNQYCLDSVVGKKPGDQWKSKRETEGSTLEFQCKFVSWGEWKKKNLVKIELVIPLQKSSVEMGTGKKQTIENEGTGEFFWNPETRETFSKLRQKIRVLGDKGSVSYSSVLTENHHYPR